jgi:uncharacterized membrane protein (DUF106 family)
VDFFRSITAGLLGNILILFEGRNPMWTLIPISLLVGVAMLWVFAHTSNQKAIRAAKQKLQAHLYELRLFTDEPALVWQAQKALLWANLRYIGLMLVPALILTIPMAILFVHLEAFYGMSPLPVGREAIVTMKLTHPLVASEAPPTLEAPAGIVVETPAVRIMGEREVSWRVRPERPVSGYLRFLLPRQEVEKKITSGPGPRYLSDRRVGSSTDLLWHPVEKRIRDANVEWIEIPYPPAKLHWLGLDLHWIVWFLVFSMATALLLKRRFRVSF